MDLLQAAEIDADHRLQSLSTLPKSASYDNPQATGMADTRFLVEKYPLDAYDVDFDYIWRDCKWSCRAKATIASPRLSPARLPRRAIRSTLPSLLGAVADHFCGAGFHTSPTPQSRR